MELIAHENGDAHAFTLNLNVAYGNLDGASDGINAGFNKDFPAFGRSELIASCKFVKSPFEESGLTTNVDSYLSIRSRFACLRSSLT